MQYIYTDKKIQAALFLLIGFVFALRVWFAAGLNIIPDEAYYWTWSRSLGWCYYDQPGMIAWIENLGTHFFGSGTPFSLRIPILLLTLGSTAVLYLTGVELFGSKIRALAAAAFLNIIPVYFAGGLLVVHDAPLIFFTLLSGLFLARLITTGNSACLYFLAFALAAAFYSKFTGIFAWLGVMLFFLASPRFRGWLKSPHFWLSAALALLLVTPVLWWNYTHDWISFRAVMKLGSKHSSSPGNLMDSVLSYQGAQALLLSPLLYGAVLVSLWQGVREWIRGKDDRVLLCLAFSVPVIIYFTYLSFSTRVQSNWTAFGYPLALLYMMERAVNPPAFDARRWVHRYGFWKWTAGTALACSLLLAAHAKFCLIPAGLEAMIPRDRLLQEFKGWPELAKRARELRAPGQVVMALRYQIASELEFYLPGQPRVYCLNAFGRGNQYDFTNDYQGLGGKDVLLVSEYPIPEKLAEKFEKVYPPVKFDVTFRGAVIKSFFIYDCHRFEHERGISLEGREGI